MKARAKDRRFFTRAVCPNICVLENISFTDAGLQQYMQAVGRDLFTEPLLETLRQFEQADNFGSLIRPALTDVGYLRGVLEGKNLGGDLFLFSVHERVMKVLKQAEFLAPRFHVVVANPPYMGGSGMNDELKDYSVTNYPFSKSDLFAMFIERNLELVLQNGYTGMITMQSWMFLSSFEDLREMILNHKTILSMAHLGARAFDTIGGDVVSTTSFILLNKHEPILKGDFFRLVDKINESEKSIAIKYAIQNQNCGWFFHVSVADFKKIPGGPIAYWVSENIRLVFASGKTLDEIASPKQGTSTGDNTKFLRFWFENSNQNIFFDCHDQHQSETSDAKWYPATKGGDYRKWYGNNLYTVNWYKNGRDIGQYDGSAIRNKGIVFQEAITWTGISSNNFGVRYCPQGFIFTISGKPIICNNTSELQYILGYLASKVTSTLLNIISPTMSFEVGYICRLPIISTDDLSRNQIISIVAKNISISRLDWNSYETSWDFQKLPLIKTLRQLGVAVNLEVAYKDTLNIWQATTKKVKNLEEENNRIFISVYGLQDELTPEVPLDDVTLTCNPYYRYGGTKNEGELEELLRADTMKEFISYAVGCMFGRYSLDKPGLVLANQGETVKDYIEAEFPWPSFTLPDEDNVIPVLEGEWFEDDIAETLQDSSCASPLAKSTTPKTWPSSKKPLEGTSAVTSSRNSTKSMSRVQETPDLLDVLQSQGQFQCADLHAPLPARYRLHRAERLSARIRQETPGAQVAFGNGLGQREHQSKPEDQGPERDYPGYQGTGGVEGIREHSALFTGERADQD